MAAVAGCLNAVPRGESCSGRVECSLDDATPPGVSNEFSRPLDALPYGTAGVVRDALESGEATARGYYSPSPETEYVVTGPGEQYYRVEATDHDPAETVGSEYAVEIGVDDGTIPDDQSIRRFVDLPPQDRESIHTALGNTGLLHAPHYTSFSVVFAHEESSRREESVFVPGTDEQYVEWEDTVLAFSLVDDRSVEITTTTVVAEPVARSQQAFVEHVGARHGVVLDGLTGDQREIVREAIEGDYAECEPYTTPLGDLLDQLSRDDGAFAPLAQYESDWYFSHVSR